MTTFSIITCISNTEIYQKCLLDSINACRHNFDIEIIPILNNNNLYSASLALNIGIKVARSNNLIIAHQDVRLLGDWFENLSRIIDELGNDWGIIGAAGVSLDFNRNNISRWGGALAGTSAVGSVWCNDIINTPPYWDGIKQATKVHCIDECLFVLNKKTGLWFDTIFNGFHLYGVDISLQARSSGYSVYAADLPIVHYGSYSTSLIGNNRYWYFMRLLHNKWRSQFPEVLGTYMHWSNNELTSYIPMELEADDGTKIYIKSSGVKEVILASDRGYEID